MRRYTMTLVAGTAIAWPAFAHAEPEPEQSWFDAEPEQGSEAPTSEAAGAEGELEAEPPVPRVLAPGTISVLAGLRLGFGGTQEFESPGAGANAEADLAPTYGLQVGADYVVMDYFAAGAELRLGWVNTEPAADRELDRDLLIDVVLKPRGRYVIEDVGLELYGTLPVGLTFPQIADVKGGDAGVGFTLGVGAGATYLLDEHWGVSGEAMWLMHWFGVDNASTRDGDASLGQFTLFANAVYAL